jgi:hypothetical protein
VLLLLPCSKAGNYLGIQSHWADMQPALSNGVNSTDPLGALRALRKLRLEQMQKRLFVLDKDARLRSGARGLQARKALVEQEKVVAESAAL